MEQRKNFAHSQKSYKQNIIVHRYRPGSLRPCCEYFGKDLFLTTCLPLFLK